MSGHALVEKYLDCVKRGDAEGLAALYAVDGVVHDPLSPEPVRGREAIAAVFAAFKRTIPDMEWRLARPLLEDGERIAFEVTVTGINDGPLRTPEGELPPTGRAVSVAMALFETLDADGLIAEERPYFDATGFAGQLGLAG